MARIRLPERAEMDAEQQKQYDEFPANLSRGLLVTKNLAKGYAALGTALRYTSLSPRIKEFVIVRVANISGSAYELMQHQGLARQQGWAEEAMAAIAENRGQYFDEEMQSVLAFVNECVEHVKVSDTVFQKVRSYLTEEQVAELTLLIGHYMMTARFLETLEIDLDTAPTSWENVRL